MKVAGTILIIFIFFVGNYFVFLIIIILNIKIGYFLWKRYKKKFLET